MKQKYDGSCHCGNVRFRASLDLDECIVCDCSICTKKGSIVIRVGESDFKMLTSIDEMSLYTFNKNIAKHYFCRNCGVHPFHRPRSYPELWAVNIRCVEGLDLGDIRPKQVYGSKLD